MNARTIPTLLGAIVMAAVSTTALAGNLLPTDGADFENVPFTDDFDFSGSGWVVPAGYTAFHSDWSRHSRDGGAYFRGWDGATSPGGIYQQVGVTPGEYTFSIWAKAEQHWNDTNSWVQIVFFDANTNVLSGYTNDISSMPNDVNFHRVAVTGTCLSNNVSFVRAGIYATYGTATGAATVLMFDYAQLTPGPYLGSFLPNNSFEVGSTGSVSNFRGTMWTNTTEYANHRPNWATRSGTNGGWAFEGYTGPDLENHSVGICARAYPTAPGSYTLSAWFKRESTNMYATNLILSVDWLGSDFTTSVQARTVANYTSFPGDNTFYEYTVTGVLTSPACAEAIIKVTVEWNTQASANAGRAAMLDDIRFVSGANTNALNLNYAYHAGGDYDGSFEPVPGTTNVLTFLQPRFAETTTLFYVMTDTNFLQYAEETGTVAIKVTYQDPVSSNYLDFYTNFSLWGTVTLDSASPFHGLPSSGTKVLNLWTASWHQPTNASGVAYTNNIQVFYSPYLASQYGIVESERRYFARNSGANFRTNNYVFEPQVFDTQFFGTDNNYYNIAPTLYSALSNGSFSADAGATNNLAGSGWQYSSDAGRDTWAARQPTLGAYLPGWSKNHERLFQYVSTTGGTYTFSTFILAENGFNMNELEYGLQWFDVSNHLVKQDRRISTLPRDKIWHHEYVTGSCSAPNVAYVRPYIDGSWGDPTNANGAVFIDDAQYYSGSYTGVPQLNQLSFETPTGDSGWRGAGGWMSEPESSGGTNASERKDWGWYTGSRGVALISYDGEGAVNGSKHQMNVTQVLTPGTGTYTFSGRFLREDNSAFTNAKLRLEWYDRSMTNQVQAPTQTNFVLVTNQYWTEYHVTGTCTDTNLYELRCVIDVQWDVNVVQSGSQAAKIDDVHFNRGEYQYHLNLEYAYHGSTASNRFTEIAPNAAGPFVNPNYATTTTTFRAFTMPNVNVRDEETGNVKIKVTYQHPVTNNFIDLFADIMTLEGQGVISAGAPFHGLPSSGSVTVNVWRYDWPMPRDAGNPPFTNAITVFYAPYVSATLSNSPSSQQQDLKYLTLTGSLANAFSDPQKFDDTFFDRDYAYTNRFDTNVCVDCDNDGLPDWWETLKFGSTTNDASADHDGDGFDNNAEFAADTDPYNAGSYFQRIITNTANGAVLTLRQPGTSTGRVYDAYWATNLMNNGGAWSAYGLNVRGNGGVLLLSVTNSATTNRYYRTGAHN